MNVLNLMLNQAMDTLTKSDEFKKAVETAVSKAAIVFDLEDKNAPIKFCPDVITQWGNSLEWYGDTGSGNRMPYRLSAYHLSNGAYYTGVWMVISNKRISEKGEIQGVSAIPDGTEPAMLNISPDVNGPCIAIEGGERDDPGHENQSIIAGYDLADIHGGQTPYSGGFGKKKFAIRAKGSMYWGNNLSNTGIVKNADIASLTPTKTGLKLKGTFEVEGRVKPKRFVYPNYSTTERDAIPDKQPGEVIFNTTTKEIEFWNGYEWKGGGINY